jgi:hypothetical protein
MCRYQGVRGALSLIPFLLAAETTGVNCTFQTDPQVMLTRESRTRVQIFEAAGKVKASSSGDARYAVAAAAIPRRNFIDQDIFDRLGQEGVSSAPIAGDLEILRRLMLDLTGMIPTPAEARAFAADANPNKRSELIGKLLYSPAFVDKWTFWLNDLMQNSQSTPAVGQRGALSRNAYHNWIRYSVANGISLKDIAYRSMTTLGVAGDPMTGAVNFTLNGRTNGPVQDTYDMMLVKSASTWLGLGYYDCLLCHDGRRHLDDLSVWGKSGTRYGAYSMAAFFSRSRISGIQETITVTEATAGTYDLNTNFGNRPNRTAIGTIRNITPVYQASGVKPGSGSWREAFAANMVKDPMFARNLANRLFKEMFRLGLVEPVDTLDPARLDPAHPAENTALAPLQASHPELLEQLAKALVERNYDLREFLRLLVESSAYQLSSRYDGEWKLENVPLYPRHYPRRLEGEEIHDAISKATGVPSAYTIQGFPDPVTLAMQVPEPAEPRGYSVASSLMNPFYRGNRDNIGRSQDGSIQQQLALMNSEYVASKVRLTASATLKDISAMTDLNQLTDELFYTFTGRPPSDFERTQTVSALTAAGKNFKQQRVEDIAWALVNKIEFIYSY